MDELNALEIHAVCALIRQRHGIASQPKLARFLDITEKTLSNWLHGRNAPDDEKTALLATLAGIAPGPLMAYHAALRATTPAAKERWLHAARVLLTANSAVGDRTDFGPQSSMESRAYAAQMN